MDAIIHFILPEGAEAMSPEVLIRYMVFVLILSCICSIASTAINMGK